MFLCLCVFLPEVYENLERGRRSIIPSTFEVTEPQKINGSPQRSSKKFFASKLKAFFQTLETFYFYKIFRSWMDWMTNLLLILNCFLHENCFDSYFFIEFCAKNISIFKILSLRFDNKIGFLIKFQQQRKTKLRTPCLKTTTTKTKQKLLFVDCSKKHYSDTFSQLGH